MMASSGASPARKPDRHQTAPKGRPTSRRAAKRAAQQALAKRRQRVTWVLVAAGLAIIVAVGLVAATSGSGGTGVTTPTGFDLPAIQGKSRIRLADFRGKPTVVNMFATWCTQCQAELPIFSRVSQELKGQVNFIGVDSLETGDRMQLPRRYGLTWWPLARDVGGSNGSGLHDALCHCDSMPVTAFYDAQGMLLNVDVEAMLGDTLASQLQRYYGIKVS